MPGTMTDWFHLFENREGEIASPVRRCLPAPWPWPRSSGGDVWKKRHAAATIAAVEVAAHLGRFVIRRIVGLRRQAGCAKRLFELEDMMGK